MELHFEDGSPVVVLATDADAGKLYEALWRLAGRVRGAITAAAKLEHARGLSPFVAQSDYLTDVEGEAVRTAYASVISPE